MDIAVVLSIARGWHVQSAKPLQSFLIPTSVAFAPNQPASLGKVTMPPGQTRRLGFNAEPLSVFEGEVTIVAQVEVASEAKPGPLDLALEVRVQPCSDRACQAPMTLRVTARVTVGK